MTGKNIRLILLSTIFRKVFKCFLQDSLTSVDLDLNNTSSSFHTNITKIRIPQNSILLPKVKLICRKLHFLVFFVVVSCGVLVTFKVYIL